MEFSSASSHTGLDLNSKRHRRIDQWRPPSRDGTPFLPNPAPELAVILNSG